MPKTIKITKAQYRQLMEAEDSDFSYLESNNDFPNYDGFNNINPNGKKDGETYADTNTTSDKIAKIRSTDWNRFSVYGGPVATCMREGVEAQSSSEPDDIGETPVFKSDKLEDEKRVQIPNIIQKRLKDLFKDLESYNLNSSQKSVILNKITPILTSSSTTEHEQKKFSKNVQKNPSSFQDSKNIANKD